MCEVPKMEKLNDKETEALDTDIDVYFNDKIIHLKHSKHGSWMLSQLQKQRMFAQFTDTELICADGTTIHAHSCILASASKRLEKKITSQPVCPGQGVVTINFRRYKYAIVRPIIDFIYSADLNVCMDQLDELIELCNLLELEVLANTLKEIRKNENAAKGSEVPSEDTGCKVALKKLTPPKRSTSHQSGGANIKTCKEEKEPPQNIRSDEIIQSNQPCQSSASHQSRGDTATKKSKEQKKPTQTVRSEGENTESNSKGKRIPGKPYAAKNTSRSALQNRDDLLNHASSKPMKRPATDSHEPEESKSNKRQKKLRHLRNVNQPPLNQLVEDEELKFVGKNIVQEWTLPSGDIRFESGKVLRTVQGQDGELGTEYEVDFEGFCGVPTLVDNLLEDYLDYKVWFVDC